MGNSKRKIDPIVVGITSVIFLGIFIFSQVNNEGFMGMINTVLNFLYDKLGWFFNLATIFAIFVAFFFMCSKYGSIRIGGPDAKPEFSKFTWWAISLCSGMGMGIVFFPPAEVIEYSFRPAVGIGLESGSYESIVWGMEMTMMHWSVTLYGVYVLGALLAAYVFFNMKQPFSVTSTLYPVFGEKVYKYRSWIDGLVNFAIVGGVAGSFGYGILQVSDGLNGKGRKLREVPILPNTVLHLQQYVAEYGLSAPEKLDRTFFVNRQGSPFTRAGATYILNKYVQMAGLDTHVSPHVLRHTKAMHLLEAGINIFYIKDFLGHEDISTTEVYAKASIETQRRALKKHSLVMPPATPSWVTNTDTLEWLKSLSK